MAEPLYRKEVEIPEEVREQYLSYRCIELVLGDLSPSFFGDYANCGIRVTLVPRTNSMPHEILAILSRKHKPDTESLTKYVDALARNERFLIDTLNDRVVEKTSILVVNGSEV